MSLGQPTAIDLFAGAGGFGLGFERSGFAVPLSLEVDTWASDTLRFNRPQMHVMEADIRDYTTAAAIQAACSFRPDIIVGGPPCQGFSVAGPAQKDPHDPRNSLFTNFARWVEVLEPAAFVLENVKGLLSRRNVEGEQVVDLIQRTFADLGYFVEVWLLNAAEYGVPQSRERLFVVGHRLGTAVGPPLPTHSLAVPLDGLAQLSFLDGPGLRPTISLWDAISDLPLIHANEGAEEQEYQQAPQTAFQRWARGENAILFNHAAMHHSPRLVERFQQIGWGESGADVPDEYGAQRRNGHGALSLTGYDQNNRRLHPYKPSHTIAASFYANFVHPFQHRNLTAREGARLQSFPDSYRFMGKKTVVSHKLLQREQRLGEKHLCQYNQIGNAVPPLLAQAVATHLKERLHLCS